MRDLRVLVVEGSVMTMYIQGETIEIPRHSIGFLLEGFVKSPGIQEELIASPAVLFSSHGNQSFHIMENSGNQTILICGWNDVNCIAKFLFWKYNNRAGRNS